MAIIASKQVYCVHGTRQVRHHFHMFPITKLCADDVTESVVAGVAFAVGVEANTATVKMLINLIHQKTFVIVGAVGPGVHSIRNLSFGMQRCNRQR